MAIAALVVGILGLILSLVPCLGMYAMPLTIIAAILGIIGMKKPQGKGMATAGMICGIIGTLIAGWWIYAYIKVKGAADQSIKDFDKEMKKQQKEMEDNAKKMGDQPDHPAADPGAKPADPADPAPAGDKPATP